MTYNPNATNTIGLEWPATRTALNFLDSMSRGHVERFSSSSAETIDALAFYLTNIGAPGRYAAEVYPAAGPFVPANQHTERSTPRTATGQNTQNDAAAFPWVDAAGGAVGPTDFSILLAGESAVTNWDDLQYVKNATAGETNAHLAFRGGGGLANFTGKRILRVDLWVRWRSDGGVGMQGRPTFENAAGNDLVVGPARKIPIRAGFENTLLGRFDVSPLTGRPWTAAEATDYFSNTSGKRFGVTVAWTTFLNLIQVSALWADVVIADENRLAFGHTDISENPGWKSFFMATPAGVDNWAKASGTDYDVLLRRIGDTGAVAWPYLEAAGQPCPHRSHRALTATLNGAYGTGISLLETPNRAHPLRLVRTDAADSSDSQPYAIIDALHVASGFTAEAMVNGAAAAGYGFIKLPLRPAIGAPDDLAPVTFKLKRVSDNVQLGGTVSLTKDQVDDFDDLGDGWKLARLQIATATLAAGVNYYIEVSSTAGPTAETRRWDVGLLTTVLKATASYGGTTLTARVNGTGAFTSDSDVPATIAIPPAAPANFAVDLVVP